jgi:hypothetical protein
MTNITFPLPLQLLKRRFCRLSLIRGCVFFHQRFYSIFLEWFGILFSWEVDQGGVHEVMNSGEYQQDYRRHLMVRSFRNGIFL